MLKPGQCARSVSALRCAGSGFTCGGATTAAHDGPTGEGEGWHPCVLAPAPALVAGRGRGRRNIRPVTRCRRAVGSDRGAWRARVNVRPPSVVGRQGKVPARGIELLLGSPRAHALSVTDRLVEEPADGGRTRYRRQHGGIGLGGILVIVGIVLMIIWSFWIGLIIALVGLVAFGGFAKGKWY